MLNTASVNGTATLNAARDWSVEVVVAGIQTTTHGSKGSGTRTA
jgi:hypothetical protein